MKVGKTLWEHTHACVIFLYYIIAFAGIMVWSHPVLLACGFVILMVTECLEMGSSNAVRVVVFDFLLATVIVIVNLLVNHRGPTLIANLWGMRLTLESLCYGLHAAGVCVVSLRIFMNFSRAMDDEKVMSLLGRRLPGVSLIISISLRLVPVIRHDMREYMQLYKGKRIRVFHALAGKTLEDGITRSMSMHDRGYGSGVRRSSIYSRRMRPAEGVYILLMFVWLAGCIYFGIYEGMSGRYFPSIYIESVPIWLVVAWCLYLLVPVVVRQMTWFGILRFAQNDN